MVKKKYRIVVSNIANDKLRSIYKFYQNKDSNQLAKKIKDGLLNEAKKLSLFPNSKPTLPIEKQISNPHRYTKKWSFKIVFQVFESENIVFINDFIHDKEAPIKWETI